MYILIILYITNATNYTAPIHAVSHIIQILTMTVMKYHVSGGLPRELYFPKGLYFPEVCSTEGKHCPEGKYNYLGTTDTWYFNRPRSISDILDGQNEWFRQNILCPMINTKFGNKTRSLRTKQTETQTWQLCARFYYDVLLLTTAYCVYAVHFFLGQFPNMELNVIVVVAFILFTELLYFCDCVTSAVITQFFDRLSDMRA